MLDNCAGRRLGNPDEHLRNDAARAGTAPSVPTFGAEVTAAPIAISPIGFR